MESVGAQARVGNKGVSQFIFKVGWNPYFRGCGLCLWEFGCIFIYIWLLGKLGFPVVPLHHLCSTMFLLPFYALKGKSGTYDNDDFWVISTYLISFPCNGRYVRGLCNCFAESVRHDENLVPHPQRTNSELQIGQNLASFILNCISFFGKRKFSNEKRNRECALKCQNIKSLAH